MIKTFSLLTFFLFSISLSAQTDKRVKAINDAFRLGEQFLLEKKYKPALRSFERVLKLNPDHIASHRAAGTCHELLGDHSNALSAYFNVLSRDPYFSRIIYYEIGRTYYRLGAYHSALDYFSQFAGLQKLGNENFGLGVERENEKELEYLQELSQSMLACQISVDSIQYLNIEAVSNLGESINSKADEYFPYVSNGSDLMFFTRRKSLKEDENLFSSNKKNGEWQEGQSNASFNSRHNEGMTTLIRSGRYMYFTACERSEVMGTCDIWEAKVDGKKVSKIKPTRGYLNSEYWESQAAISCDGSRIFFASNRDGGLGGTDIWMSEKEPDGSWDEPVNLGPNVNTAADEEAPFITSDGKTIYFSSTGHFGMGEGDIYFSRMQNNGHWAKARNLGKPVNSSARELGIFLSADGQTGYFASNREGGHGGMDIYKFTLPTQLTSDPVTYVQGQVKSKLDKLPVRPSTILIPGRDPIEVDERGRFFICFPAHKNLKVEAVARDYRPYEKDFQIPYWDNKEFYEIEIWLEHNLMPLSFAESDLDTLSTEPRPLPTQEEEEKPEPERVSILSLYYATSESNLNTDNKNRLDRFLKSLEKDKIKKVEIIGFADYVGSDVANMKLSEDRARAVANFIESRSVEVSSFFLEGKGEIATEELEQNRRVDIIVHSKHE